MQLFKYPSPIKARVSERNKNILHCNHKKPHLFATEPSLEKSKKIKDQIGKSDKNGEMCKMTKK